MTEKTANIDLGKLRTLMSRRNAARERGRNLTDRYLEIRTELQRATDAYERSAKGPPGRQTEGGSSNMPASDRHDPRHAALKNLEEEVRQIQAQRDAAHRQIDALDFVDACIEYARKVGIVVEPDREVAYVPAKGTPRRIYQ